MRIAGTNRLGGSSGGKPATGKKVFDVRLVHCVSLARASLRWNSIYIIPMKNAAGKFAVKYWSAFSR